VGLQNVQDNTQKVMGIYQGIIAAGNSCLVEGYERF